MSDLNKVMELKAKVDQLQRETDRAGGALEQTMARLKKEYHCDTVEEAEALLKRLHGEKQKANKVFTEVLTSFEENWRDVFDR